MDYNEALSYIHGTQKFGWKLGLHNMQILLGLMGNPHKKLKYVHVAGTNGKGSTVAFISSMLIQAGYKTGIFTSPFLERFSERIKINDEEIPRDCLARLTSLVKEKIDIMLGRGENNPTEFELITAIAFQYFFEKGCDVAVLEVGIGGRFDSTNIIDAPLVSVITTINYDHMDILGDTLEKIAFEKAGIIKPGCDVVVYPNPDNVEKVFIETCREKGAAFHRADFSGLKHIESSLDGQIFDYERYKSLKISLLGHYQFKNAAVAIKAAEILNKKGLSISEAAMRDGLARAKWPGRFEVLKRNPVFIIDGAHNVEATNVLIQELKTYFPSKKITFIIGVLKDKEYKLMIEAAAAVSERFITVTPESGRALSAENLAILLKSYCKNIIISDTIKGAAETACRITSAEDVICAFGSLYYIGQIRSCIK